MYSVMSDSATPWTQVCQVSSVHGILQARIPKLVAYPLPGDLPNLGIEPASLVFPVWAGEFFTT